jgi:hypothetical protein
MEAGPRRAVCGYRALLCHGYDLLACPGTGRTGISGCRQSMVLTPGTVCTIRSWSRLLQRQGKPAEAHQLLAPIYGWSTEGFDTADLQEAKAQTLHIHGAVIVQHGESRRARPRPPAAWQLPPGGRHPRSSVLPRRGPKPTPSRGWTRLAGWGRVEPSGATWGKARAKNASCILLSNYSQP